MDSGDEQTGESTNSPVLFRYGNSDHKNATQVGLREGRRNVQVGDIKYVA